MAEMQEMPPFLEVEAGSPPNTPPLSIRFFRSPELVGIVDGYPKHRDVIFCEKTVPGNRNSIHCQPMNDTDKKRFPKAWAIFEDVTSIPREGMPIEQWPQITKSEAMNLRAMNIHTIEALAAVSEHNLGNLGQGGRELVNRAKSFLEQAKDGAVNAQLAQQNQALKDDLAAMKAQMETLQKLVTEKRGPGRPKKEAEAA